MGCPRCEKLKQDLMALMAELNIAAGLEHVRDPLEIASYGVMGSPALIIDGEVKSAGSVSPNNTLKEWLIAAAKSSF
jgi:hypothetical protein